MVTLMEIGFTVTEDTREQSFSPSVPMDLEDQTMVRKTKKTTTVASTDRNIRGNTGKKYAGEEKIRPITLHQKEH